MVGDFDEGVDKRDIGAARTALDRMRRLAEGDGRFVLAVADCEARLNTMPVTSQSPAPPPARAVSSAPATPASRVAKLPEFPAPPRAPSAVPAQAGSSPSKNLTMVATVAGIAILLVIFFWVRSRGIGVTADPVTRGPVVATATISAATADLLEAPNAPGKPLAVLLEGRSVNVLAIPGAVDRDYTRVQPAAAGKPLPAGFVRTADLSNWSAKNDAAAFSIIQLFAPAETAGESELNAQVEKWNEFIARFPASPRMAAAHLESARLELSLAKLGKGDAEWQLHADRARKALAEVTGSLELESQAAQLRLQLSQPVAHPATPPVAPPVTNLSAERILRTRVNSLWEDGKYQQAMQLVDQILASSPNHQEALLWKKKIRASQDAEARVQ